MRVSIPWLKQFVNIKQSSSELADMLTMLGLEADIPKTTHFSGVVVGKVLKADKHPNADRLSLCVVTDGQDEYQVVCGAPNVAAEQKVPFAKVGALLGNDHKITKAKIRGEQSLGMICSERELGISEEHEGILVLNDGADVGSDFAEYLTSSQEYLDIDLTPNRPDCMSHVGVAREIAVMTDQKLTYKTAKPRKYKQNEVEEILTIKIEDKDRCPRYVAGVVKNIEVKPSPDWLRELLETAGQRSINNIVDISNYVLMEMGHPTHIFDYDKIPSKTVGIRMAKKGEKVKSLDEENRNLIDELVITDGEKPIAIAGLMGGFESAVNNKTKNVLIESAYFDPITIRKGSKSLGLSTEASKRFERGADPDAAVHAFWRVVELLEELAGGEWVPGLIDAYPKKIKPPTISLTREKIDILSGCELTDKFVKDTLSSLGIEVKKDGKSKWHCTPPSNRPDLEREIDLIEELCRIHGYDNIRSHFHYGGLYDMAEVDPEDVLSQIANTMSGLGFNQCYLNSLTDVDTAHLGSNDPVEMINPLNKTMSHLRTSLLPGLLQSVNYNIRNGSRDLCLFEIGKEYNKKDEKYHLAGVMHGKRVNRNVHENEQNQTIFSLKGVISAMFSRLNVYNVKFHTDEHSHYEYGFSISMNDSIIGYGGKFSEKLINNLDIDSNDIFGFDIHLEPIITEMKNIVKYSSPVQFPIAERDMNFVINNSETVIDLKNTITKAGGKYLISVRPVDIFQHESLGENHKSVTFHLEFQSAEKTLEEAEVNTAMKNITAVLSKQFNAKLRD